MIHVYLLRVYEYSCITFLHTCMHPSMHACIQTYIHAYIHSLVRQEPTCQVLLPVFHNKSASPMFLCTKELPKTL